MKKRITDEADYEACFFALMQLVCGEDEPTEEQWQHVEELEEALEVYEYLHGPVWPPFDDEGNPLPTH